MTPLLTRQQCNAARGLAIAGIVLHNYCHAFPFAIQESEFKWQIEESMRWCDYLKHIDANVFINFFSWGVSLWLPAFIFLSGYGLVAKYENGGAPLSPGRFIWKEYRKLLALLIVPLAAFIALQLLALGKTPITSFSLVAQVGMFINLVPKLSIVPGPYWYLGMMMQLYVLYAVIHRFRGTKAQLWIPVGLIILGFALHIIVPRELYLAAWLRQNATVGFIPLALGMLAARYGRAVHLTTTRAALLFVVLTVASIAFFFDYTLWGLVYGTSSIALVCLATLLRGKLLHWAEALGRVSALVYILHPVVRFAVMAVMLRMPQFPPYGQIAIYLLLTALAVYLYRKLGIDEKVNKLFGIK